MTPPIDLGWKEVLRGNGSGENPTRHEISLIHACRLTGEYMGSGRFFPIGNLPANIGCLHHPALITEGVKRLSRRLDGRL